MASCITSQWSSNAPQCKLNVSESSSTATTVTLSWSLQYISAYPAYTNGYGRAFTAYIDGTCVADSTYNINQVTGTNTITSGTITVNKTTSARNVSFSCSFTFDVTWGGTYGGTKSASSSISIGAKTSYAVKYDANGGSGAPGDQTKWHGDNLTLSSTTPTRTGYSFQKWNTNSSGTGTNYSADATYSANAAVTLYAVWKADTYTVSYDANGGTGAPSNQTKTYGVNLTLSSTKPTRTNYNFLGWGTAAGSTTVAYAAGATYSGNAALTLYAIWELAYVPPSITDLVVYRCNSAGTALETGTYYKLEFNWSCDQTIGNNTIKSITYKVDSGTATSISVSTSLKTGSVSTVLGGSMSIETSYVITVAVTDDMDGTTTKSVTLTATKFAIDVKSGGTGVAFGKPADTDNLFDVNFNARFRKTVDIDSTLNVDGAADFNSTLTVDGAADFNSTLNVDGASTFQGLASFGGGIDEITRIYAGDCNSVTRTSVLYCGNSATNKPGGLNGWLTSKVYGDADYIWQEYVTYTGVRYSRLKSAGTWQEWIRTDKEAPLKCLWSGCLYMASSQMITLTEPISKQQTGICLVWSPYSASYGAYNYDFVYSFIPKTHVLDYSGSGVGCWIADTNYYNSPSGKYVYVTDNTIQGSDYYNKGIAANYVLRCVYGV